MRRHLFLILLVIGVFASGHLLAGDESVPCDRRAKKSEYSWNPDNRYITARLRRFYDLNEQISVAYKGNEFGRAKDLAKESLELAAIYRCNWNYGNAIHNSNRIMGLIALENGDVDTAVDYLLKAGKTTGSPQLDSFGPKLNLANELLKLGKVDAVKTYLEDIGSFWETNDGKVDAWLASIEKGEKPELNRFPRVERRIFSLFVFWLAILWPSIVPIVFIYLRRKRISKKLPFIIASILSGYFSLYSIYWIMGYVIGKILEMEYISNTVLVLTASVTLGMALILPVLATFGVARAFSENDEVANKMVK